MKLQPVAIENIPVGGPLPWQLYDRFGRILLAAGEVVKTHQELKNLLARGLSRDMDEPQGSDSGNWIELRGNAAADIFPPPGIRPQIWERVQLRLPDQGTQTVHLSHLIGYIHKQSILVTAPVENGIPIILKEGEHAEVRMATGDSIHVFDTTIQRVCISPVHYMHLRYPASARILKLRKSPWARVHLSATITNAQGAREAAHVINLSPDGAHIQAPKSIGAEGAPLQFALHAVVGELSATLNLNARIEHVQPAQADPGSAPDMQECGIAFLDVSTEHTLWLRCMVYQHVAEGYLA